MSTAPSNVSCVVPALDAATTLPAVIAGLRTALPRATLIVVDDGSGDDTPAAARNADEVIRFPLTRGKGAALRAGIETAVSIGATAVVTLDADGQHDPAHAPALLAALDDADVAIGSRARDPRAMPLGRRLTNRLASAAIGRLTGVTLPDAQSGYRAVQRHVLERVHAVGDRYEYETDFLIRVACAGFRIVSVPITTMYGPASHFRAVGDSVRVVRCMWAHRHRSGAHR